MRPRTKVIESCNGRYDRRERIRHSGLDTGREVQLASDHVIVERSVESGLNLRRGTAERDPRAATSDVVNGKALRHEPHRDQVHISLRDSESVSKFLGREPAMVIGRAGIVLRD